MGKGDVDGAGKKEEFQSQHGVEEGETFGPWVLVTQKRKPSMQSVKDSLGFPFRCSRPKPKVTQETNPFILALGPTKVDFHSREGKRKPINNLESFVACVDHMIELVACDKQRFMLQKQKDKHLSQNLKSKKKSRELPTWKGKDSGAPLV